jgi:hypothetical protein
MAEWNGVDGGKEVVNILEPFERNSISSYFDKLLKTIPLLQVLFGIV